MTCRILRASGFWNLALASTLLYPPLYRTLGLNLTQPVWGWLIAGFLLYTSATLILGSRDLRIFGGIILWEGLLRFLGAAILIPAACSSAMAGSRPSSKSPIWPGGSCCSRSCPERSA
jgi:hypothetical protein